MSKPFFEFSNHREFLKSRFEEHKLTRANFSARSFAREAQVASPSYFKLVVEGDRVLSSDYAKRFARGLKLTQFETSCLVTSVEVENAKTDSERRRHLAKLHALEQQASPAHVMSLDHAAILADLANLKLYLLATSQKFRLSYDWLESEFGFRHTRQNLEQRVKRLVDSGLWQLDGKKIAVIAPKLHTGHELPTKALLDSHLNILEAAKKSLLSKRSDERIASGLTILFNASKMKALQNKIEDFKREIEAEFESTLESKVYQMQINFFEIESGDAK